VAIVLPEIEYCLLFCLSAIPGTSVAWVLDTLSLLAQGICKRTWTCLVTTAPHVNHLSRNLCGAEGEYTHRDLGSSFQLNMCWQLWYCWQDKGIERKWRMSCQGSSCETGEPLWLPIKVSNSTTFLLVAQEVISS